MFRNLYHTSKLSLDQGCRNDFLHGGPNSIFLPLRATSVKPEFQKKFALLTEIKKNYLIRF